MGCLRRPLRCAIRAHACTPLPTCTCIHRARDSLARTKYLSIRLQKGNTHEQTSSSLRVDRSRQETRAESMADDARAGVLQGAAFPTLSEAYGYGRA